MVLYDAFVKWVGGTPAYRWINPRPAPLRDKSERLEWADYLATDEDAQIHTSSVTEILLREIKYVLDSKIDLIKSTDAKAAMEVTVLGGGLGILSVLGATRSEMITSGNPWLLGAATVLIVMAAALDLWCLARGYRYTSHLPDLEIYNTRAILDDRQMAGRVSSSIIEGYTIYSNELTAVNARKSRLLKAATIVVVFGVLCLIGNAVWADTHSGKPKSDATCHFSTETVNCILEPE